MSRGTLYDVVLRCDLGRYILSARGQNSHDRAPHRVNRTSVTRQAVTSEFSSERIEGACHDRIVAWADELDSARHRRRHCMVGNRSRRRGRHQDRGDGGHERPAGKRVRTRLVRGRAHGGGGFRLVNQGKTRRGHLGRSSKQARPRYCDRAPLVRRRACRRHRRSLQLGRRIGGCGGSKATQQDRARDWARCLGFHGKSLRADQHSMDVGYLCGGYDCREIRVPSWRRLLVLRHVGFCLWSCARARRNQGNREAWRQGCWPCAAAVQFRRFQFVPASGRAEQGVRRGLRHRRGKIPSIWSSRPPSSGWQSRERLWSRCK